VARVPRWVYVSEHGNVFMTEIAEHLVEASRLAGEGAELVTDRLPEPGVDPLDQLVVAPHEFFGLFRAAEAARFEAAAHSACVNTEQAGTPFFDVAMPYIARGQVAFDINPFSLDTIRSFGGPAVHLPLGYVPSMDRWRAGSAQPAPPTAIAQRSIDLAFLGGRTERREAFIAGAAGALWEWRTDLRFFSWHRPATATNATFASGDAKYASLADARILLNVHRSDDPYFEWARVVEAMANGCVVASERSVGFEPLVPGVHFLMADLDDLAEEAIALAFDEPRRSAMAEAAHAVMTGPLHQRELLVAALAEARSMRDVSRPHRGRLRRTWKPLHVEPARPARPPMTAERQMLEKTVRDLKRAYLAGVANVRSIERAIAIAEHGDAKHVEVVASPAWEVADPEVSVVVPLYNQGHFLTDAVRSVVAATARLEREVELIVVDDHSTDASCTVAADLLGEMPWLPSQLLARAANGGLPAARNTGFERARGRYVFALDADNLLYPSALAVLADRLDRSDADVIATYGLLERFGPGGAVGLTSHLPWDPDLLVRGAFIDAMALFRKDAWQSLGGYADDPGVFGGWEDYELWLSAAERGLRAELVPQIVGRYREHAGSMRRISDIDMTTNFVLLRERHPRLPWPS